METSRKLPKSQVLLFNDLVLTNTLVLIRFAGNAQLNDRITFLIFFKKKINQRLEQVYKVRVRQIMPSNNCMDKNENNNGLKFTACIFLGGHWATE